MTNALLFVFVIVAAVFLNPYWRPILILVAITCYFYCLSQSSFKGGADERLG